MVLCTKQRALWLFEEDKTLTPPANFKLGTLCQYFGIPLPADEAHDAFRDVRAAVALYQAMCQHQQRPPECSQGRERSRRVGSMAR
jgi:DNA polymerase III epsilon subunit-like protein